MSPRHKLSLWAAIFININIMLGSGIFINTTVLAKKAGILGALSYLCIGLLMLPLIFSMSKLLSLHPSGGFYTFAQKELNTFAGFFSTWGYIIGKLASATIIIHISMLLLQQIIPALNAISVLLLDSSIILCFVALNMLDIRTNAKIQSLFLSLKLIPIISGVAIGLYLISPSLISQTPMVWEQIPFTLPLVLFAISGFEATCSLSSRIEHAEKNGPIAIFVSYGFVIAATTLFQFALSGALGETLGTLFDYRSVFPALFEQAFSAHATRIILTSIMHLSIVASALGGAYGIIFSNVWNVYTLAQHNHLFQSERFSLLNRFSIPWLCVLFEGFICLLYLFISRGSQLPLQQIGALGVTIAYTLSALSLIAAYRKNRAMNGFKRGIPYLALGCCILLIGVIINNLIINGISSLILYSVLLSIGIFMYMVD